MIQLLRKFGFSITQFALLLSLFASVVHAQTNLESTILLREDGSAVVMERYESAGILWPFLRRIPVHEQTAFEHRLLRVEMLEVKDGENHPLQYHTRFSGRWLTIEVDSGAARELQLVYLVRNAMRFAADHDEFYWPVNPPGMALAQAEVRLRPPAALTGRYTAQLTLLRGLDTPAAAQWSSNGQVPLRTSDTELRAVTPGPLAPGISMVVDLVADKDVFTPPSLLQRVWWYGDSNRIILLPLFTLLLMLILRRLRGPEVVISRSVAPMYEPPKGLSPAECGALMTGTVEARDITATLVDLAGRGYIRMEYADPQPGLALDRRDFIFRLLKPKEEWEGLAPHESTMLFHTFYGGHWTMLSSLRLRFPEIVPLLREEILLSLRQKGMYRQDLLPAQALRQAGLMGIGVILVILQRQLGMEFFTSPWLAFLMIALSAGLVFLLDRNLAGRTARGTRAYIALLGLQEFITTVEGDRLEHLEAGVFEKLLPYAMALGIEHKLAHAFEGIAIPAPQWFGSPGEELFVPAQLSHQLGLLSLAATLGR